MKIIAPLVVVASVFLVAGCGSNTETINTTVNSTIASEEVMNFFI